MENSHIKVETLEEQYALLEEHNRDLVARIRHISTENRQQFKLIETLIEHSPMGILLFDKERRILQSNKAAESMLGIDRVNLIGKSCEKIFDCYQLHKCCPLLDKDIQFAAEETTFSGNNKKRTVLRSTSVTDDNNDTVIIEAFLDVTRAKKNQKKLEQATRARDEFFDKMTHELRTPLNGIFGFAEIMKMRLQKNDTAKFDEYLDNILKSGTQLLKLVEGMLEIADISSGRVILQESEVLIDDVLARVEFKYHSNCSEANNILTIENHCNTTVIVSDPERLLRVLENLVDNACRFTRDGQIVIKAYEEVCEGKPCLLFQVSDTGIGIPEDKHESIFHVAEQVDNSLSRSYEGVGIGLTIAQGLAKLMAGKITVESVLGKGSTFTLKVPAKIPRT